MDNQQRKIAANRMADWRELDAASTDARFFGGMTLGVGVYFAVAGLAQLLALTARLRERDAAARPAPTQR